MEKLLKFLCVAFFVFAINTGWAQQSKVTGTVTDNSGMGIPGATVLEKGTSNGTITDGQGKFTLQAGNGKTIVFSFVGMTSKEVVFNGQRELNVTLVTDDVQLDEVVAIGYGTKKKSELASAVVQMGGEIAMKTPSVNLTNSLQGQLAGLNIKQRAGSPGTTDPVINIRGANTFRNSSALIVIDGIASADPDGLNRLNPNEIASISVLKDASAAIYGIQASGGVIVVTTKRGEIGTTKVNVMTSSAFQSPTRYADMADAPSLMKAINARNELEGTSIVYSKDDIAEFTSGKKKSTDWQKALWDTPVYQGKYDITVSGGIEKVKYFIGGSMATQGSALVNDDKNKNTQYNLRSNIDVNLFKGMDMQLDLSYREHERQTNTYGGDGGLALALVMNPAFPAFVNDDVNLPTNGDAYWSPVAVSQSEGFQRWNKKVYGGKVNFKYMIPNTGGLYVSSFASLIHTINFNKSLITPYHYYSKNVTTGAVDKIPTALAGTWVYGVHDRFDQNTRATFHAQIGYDHLFNDVHSVSAFAAYQDMTFKSNNLYGGRTEYNSYAIPELFAGVANTSFFKNDGKSEKFASQTFFGRASYDYKKKYLLSFNFRADGSAIFAPANRWGYFPGFSAGWVVTNEEFMPERIFSNLKLRASWGKLGNDRVNPFQFLSAYGFTQGAIINNANTQGMAEAGTANPNIKWEVATSSNIGLEMSFMDNKLALEFDYFHVLTEDILAKKNFSVPDYTGLVLPDQNIGTMENGGFEFQASYKNRVGKFNYSIGGNVATNQNEITFFDEVPNADPKVAAYQQLTGNPFKSPLLMHAIGIYKTNDEAKVAPTYPGAKAGYLKFEDKNGDGKIDSNDQYRKALNPELNFGMQISASYGNFDLAMYFNGRHGDYWQFNNNVAVSQANILQYAADNTFSLANPNAELPKSNLNSNNLPNDFNLLTKTWFRFKTLNLGYTITNNAILSKVSISKFRIYASADNFLMLYNNMDKYGATDPELDSVYGDYPLMRTYNIGVDVTF